MLKDMRGGWSVLTGDISWETYGAKWCKKAPDGSWWVLRFENCEEWGDGATGYSCDIQRIDLASVPSAEIASALSSCGLKISQEEEAIICPHNGNIIAKSSDDHFEMVLVECLSGYGTYAPMGEEIGESYPERVRAAARKAADEMMADTAATAVALAKPINRIGTTAAENGRGAVLAPLHRKAAKVVSGKKVALTTADRIILQMYNATDGATLGGAVEIKLAAAGKVLKEMPA